MQTVISLGNFCVGNYLSDKLECFDDKVGSTSRIADHFGILGGELGVVPASQGDQCLKSRVSLFQTNESRIAAVVQIGPWVEHFHLVSLLVQHGEGVDQVGAFERVQIVHPVLSSAFDPRNRTFTTSQSISLIFHYEFIPWR